MMFGTWSAAALVDRRAQRRFEPRVILRAVQRVGNGAAGTERIHRRNEAVLLERRPVGGSDQIESLDAEPRRFAAAVLERHVAAGEDAARDALLDAALEGRVVRARSCA